MVECHRHLVIYICEQNEGLYEAGFDFLDLLVK